MDALQEIFQGFLNLEAGQVLMMAIGGFLIFLAIVKGFEPLLLIPIGTGIFLANIPVSGVNEEGGLFFLLQKAGLHTGLFPLLIFIGLGALTDFSPLLSNPVTILLGAAAQFGIFAAFLLAYLGLGFGLKDAAAIGIIGSADGPTTIYASTLLAHPDLWGPVAVAAYSYMALVPVIQPPIIRLLTTRRERLIRMFYGEDISKPVRIIFPLLVTLIASLFVPKAAPLIGALMFGNLLRESGVVERLSHAAQNELSNVVTILLGITVGSTMTAQSFLHLKTFEVFFLGLAAFIFATATGVMLGKLMCVLSRGKVNPIIGAAGISAIPMSARVCQKVAHEEDYHNFILMQAMGSNVAGQIGSPIAAGVLMGLLL